MNQITPPPHEGTQAHEPPADHNVLPHWCGKAVNGRLILAQ